MLARPETLAGIKTVHGSGTLGDSQTYDDAGPK